MPAYCLSIQGAYSILCMMKQIFFIYSYTTKFSKEMNVYHLNLNVLSLNFEYEFFITVI